jgi:NNP family nitrate/nitrite transporter-like MFS transporter
MFKKSNYKWYILILAMLAYGIITGLDRMCLPVLFKEISTDLGLSMVSIGAIWGMDPLAGVFVCILGGLLADHFGIKRTLTIACILAGIFCALRGFSTNFITMSASMFLFGLMATIIFTVTPKITAVWFSGRYLGITNALLQVSMSVFAVIGTMLSATVLSPLLGGWRNVLFVFGAPAILIGILWWITGREPEKSEMSVSHVNMVPFKEAFFKVIRTKEVWIFGLIQLSFMGTMTGVGGYLAIYLRNIGWSPVSADTALTIQSATGIVGMIPMMLLANRLHSPKGMFIFSLVVLAVSLAMLPYVKGNAVYVLLIVSGLLRAAAPALCSTMIFEIKGIGSTYGGTAMGLATTLGMVGAFGAPALGNSFARISPGGPFIFWAVLAAAAIPLFLLIKTKSQNKDESKAPAITG